jgi:hypothetical protein
MYFEIAHNLMTAFPAFDVFNVVSQFRTRINSSVTPDGGGSGTTTWLAKAILSCN